MKAESHNNNDTHHCFVPIINVKQTDTFFATVFRLNCWAETSIGRNVVMYKSTLIIYFNQVKQPEDIVKEGISENFRNTYLVDMYVTTHT